MEDYSTSVADKALKKAGSQTQEELLLKRKNKERAQHGVPFVTSYHPRTQNVFNIIKENWKALHDSCMELLESPSHLAFGRNCNLADKLASSHYKSEEAYDYVVVLIESHVIMSQRKM